MINVSKHAMLLVLDCRPGWCICGNDLARIFQVSFRVFDSRFGPAEVDASLFVRDLANLCGCACLKEMFALQLCDVQL